jgi:hypothetical protein
MSNLDDLSARLAAIAAKTPGQQERLAEIMARIEGVEPVDPEAPAERKCPACDGRGLDERGEPCPRCLEHPGWDE